MKDPGLPRNIPSFIQVPTRAEGPRRDVEYKITEIFAFGQALFFPIFLAGVQKNFCVWLVTIFKGRDTVLRKTRHMSILIQYHYKGPKKFLRLVSHYFQRMGHRFAQNASHVYTHPKSPLEPEKPFVFGLIFLFGVTPRSHWPTSGLEFQAKSSVPNNKTFGLDPIIF